MSSASLDMRSSAYPMAMPRELHDHYFRQAKREGYLSRAAYKLIEIDDRRKILHPGDRILDCGCAPGSWLQVASTRVGPQGLVVGIDLTPVTCRFPLGNVRTIVGDLRETPAATLLDAVGGRPFHAILSDMAPSTTGDRNIDHHQSMRLCHAMLDRCHDLLGEGGHIVVKAFEGEAYSDLLARAASMFQSVKGFRPKASRGESTEMYIIARHYRPADDRPATPAADEAPAPPRPRPSPGWQSNS
jgi:23S rRNA (uridine2552-2'-O)-methyltransferase